MKQINLFPTELFEFENSSMDNRRLIDLCKKERFREHGALSSLENIHIKPEFDFFFSWVNQCLDEFRISRRYDCDSISLTSSWCNQYQAGSGDIHMPHKHSMSWYSGIYYLTDGAPTLFDDPVVHRSSAQIEVLRHNWQPLVDIPAKAGKLILFPSWLPHSTMRHIDMYDRWTIAFNTLPSGKVNYNLARDSIAILDVGTKNEFE